jgi:hypothetical protein
MRRDLRAHDASAQDGGFTNKESRFGHSVDVPQKKRAAAWLRRGRLRLSDRSDHLVV